MSGWTDALLGAVLEALRNLPPELAVLVVAMVPVFELRAAVPLGIGLGLDPLRVLVVAFIGNMLPIPFLLLLLEPVTQWLRRHSRLRRLADWMYARTEARGESVRRYGWWGLVLLVAIPLPMTGAWTAAMVAALAGMNPRSGMAAIALGVGLAGLVVTVITMLGWSLLR